MAAATDLARMVPGFDFLQGLLKNAGAGLPNMGQWVAPTLNVEELDKRIEELAKWLSIHIGNWPEDEWELCAKPNYWHGRANDLAAAYPSLLDETSATS